MKMRNLFLLSLSLTVAACGGSGGGSSNTDIPSAGTGGGGPIDDGPADGTIRYFGVVSVDEDVEDNEVEADAGFIRYASDLNADLFADIITPTLDACTVEVSDLNFDPEDFDLPVIDSTVDFETVSAGSVLTLMSGAGSYLELVQDTDFGFTIYNSQPEYADGPLPAQLTLDIPGAEFPQFANVNMPVVQSLVMTSPDDSTPILPSTTFTWNAGSNPAAYLNISVQAINTDLTVTSVDCVVKDDGAFSFPTQTQREMGPAFTAFGSDTSREAQIFEQQGDAILLLSSSSE